MTSTQSEILDFQGAGGGVELRTLRWIWNVDEERLKDVNRASGMDGTASHLRGFLCRLVTMWMDTPASRRPAIEASETFPEDLVYIPSPCYVFAHSKDRTTLQCWYSVLVDAGCDELLEGKAGVRIFTLEGDPDFVASYIEGIVRLFRFRSITECGGHTFYRRF